MDPNKSTNQERTRTIVGLSYWFPHQGNVSTALLLDYDNATFKNFTPATARRRRRSPSTRSSISKETRDAMKKTLDMKQLSASRRCAGGRDARARRRCRSTAAGATFPASDLFEVVLASTTSCTRTSRSTTSRSGPGAGIQQITERTVFFGATDGPMTPEQLHARRRARSCTSRPCSARWCRSTTSRACRRS